MNPHSQVLDDVRNGAFFLVGCERSGTTLLQAMLDSHPDVAIASETQFYGAFYRRDPTAQQLRSRAGRERAIKRVITHQRRRGMQWNEDLFETLARAELTWGGIFTALLAAFREAQGVRRVGEKSPAHTRFTEAIASDFPRARFIHLLRDPRAVVNSLMRVPFGSRFVAPNVELWRQAFRIHLSSGRLLQTGCYHPVLYEDLVHDPRPVLEGICSFLGLSWHDDIEKFHRRDQPVFQDWEMPWKQGTMKPVFRSSVDAWRNQLSREQIQSIELALGEEIKAMGLAITTSATSSTRARWLVSRGLGSIEGIWRRSQGIIQRRVLGRYPSDSRARVVVD